MKIGARIIGPGEPVFVIAEIGGNHGGRLDLALEMIEAAATAGADAVKFQTYRTGAMLSARSRYYDELAAEELTPSDLAVLKLKAEEHGLIFFSTAFDFDSVDALEALGVDLFKIASGDINNLPLIGVVAQTKKPLILSTGAAEIDEIQTAIDFARTAGADDIALMQCTVSYPCPDDQINLRAIPALIEAFNLPVGFSDHSLGIDLALGAVALGASFVEKHFTIDRSLPGGDNEMSIMPKELEALVRGAARIHRALGDGRKRVMPVEAPLQTAIRRSLVAAVDIPEKTVLGPEHLALRRPGDGEPPETYFEVVDRIAKADIKADEPVTRSKVVDDA